MFPTNNEGTGSKNVINMWIQNFNVRLDKHFQIIILSDGQAALIVKNFAVNINVAVVNLSCLGSFLFYSCQSVLVHVVNSWGGSFCMRYQ